MPPAPDRDVRLVERIFHDSGIPIGWLVPTDNGLKKSVLDAHEQLRNYLLDTGIHNFLQQSQGQASKVTVRSWFVHRDRLEPTAASLYRPESGNGDPRLWFKALGSYAKSGNVLAVIGRANELYVVNASDDTLLATLTDSKSPLGKLVARLREPASGQATVSNPFLELLLTLQQDGPGAISAPSSWASPPILEVSETTTYRAADAMARDLLSGTQRPRWHFFVGSPGNGKSAATGRLVRALVIDNDWKATDEKKRDILEAAQGTLPVAISVMRPGSSDVALVIVQDASVVSDPYSSAPDPSDDFLRALEAARRFRASTWICVNRGVLERAIQKAPDEGMKAALRGPAEGKAAGRCTVPLAAAEDIDVSWDVLDSHSLISSTDKELEALLEQGTASVNWDVGSSRVDLQACKLEYSIVSPK